MQKRKWLWWRVGGMTGVLAYSAVVYFVLMAGGKAAIDWIVSH